MGQNGSGLQPPSLGVVFWKVLMSQDEHFIILEVLAVQETSLNEECLKSTPPTPPRGVNHSEDQTSADNKLF